MRASVFGQKALRFLCRGLFGALSDKFLQGCGLVQVEGIGGARSFALEFCLVAVSCSENALSRHTHRPQYGFKKRGCKLCFALDPKAGAWRRCSEAAASRYSWYSGASSHGVASYSHALGSPPVWNSSFRVEPMKPVFTGRFSVPETPHDRGICERGRGDSFEFGFHFGVYTLAS